MAECCQDRRDDNLGGASCILWRGKIRRERRGEEGPSGSTGEDASLAKTMTRDVLSRSGARVQATPASMDAFAGDSPPLLYIQDVVLFFSVAGCVDGCAGSAWTGRGERPLPLA